VDGKTVVDLWGGAADAKSAAPWTKDTVSIVFSCTKGATALCAHMLASRGKLDLDAPVTGLWPEFGQNGKERVTTRMMLDHSAGVPALRDKVKGTGPYEWDYMTGRLAAEAPFWEPGTRNGYHGLTFGWTVGEMVRRASGKSLGTFFQDEVAKPLGLDFWIGLPEAIEPRVAPMQPFVNRREQAVTPFLRALTEDKRIDPGTVLFQTPGRLLNGRPQHARRPRRGIGRGKPASPTHVDSQASMPRWPMAAASSSTQRHCAHGRSVDGDPRRRHLAHPDALCLGLHEVDGQPPALGGRQDLRRGCRQRDHGQRRLRPCRRRRLAGASPIRRPDCSFGYSMNKMGPAY
jgi:CubicO group peptidase (beta-lactamase class C family)